MIFNNKEYFSADTREKITIPDSYVVNENKLGTAHGEAKLYIGSVKTKESKEYLRSFYGSNGFIIKCFVYRDNLLNFIDDLKSEYQFPSLLYRGKKDFPELYKIRRKKVLKMEPVIWFNMHEQTQIKKPRIYIKSNDKTDSILREFALKHLSYLSFLKLKAKDGETIFRTRLFIDTLNRDNRIISKKENNKIEIKDKYQKTKIRPWQAKYREDLLKQCPYCPVTLVNDERLLQASHIKPVSKCKNSNEKTDPKNGFMLTHTIHKLFDEGFITFDKEKKMILSPWLSPVTWTRLNIKHNKTIEMLPIKGREKYLKYHRENRFKS